MVLCFDSVLISFAFSSGIVSQKENEDLFFIDTKGKNSTDAPISAKPVKKFLKIDHILKPESAFSIGRSHQTKGSRAEDLLIAKKTKYVLNEPHKKSTSNEKEKSSLYDAWADETPSSSSHAKTAKFTPILPAVPVPLPTASYNPVRDEHLAHLEALEVAEIERLARNEAFKERLPRTEVCPESLAAYDLVSVANRKLALGQYSDNEDEDDNEGLVILETRKKTTKKTIQDRKRQLRHKKLIQQHSAFRIEKMLLNSIEHVPGLLADIKTVHETRKTADELLAPIEKEIQTSRKINRIKKRLVMEPLSVKFPEELPASMRQLAPEGNLITDRFRNMIERGFIEPTTHKILSTETKSNNRRLGESFKPRIKMVEKYSYKNFK